MLNKLSKHKKTALASIAALLLIFLIGAVVVRNMNPGKPGAEPEIIRDGNSATNNRADISSTTGKSDNDSGIPEKNNDGSGSLVETIDGSGTTDESTDASGSWEGNTDKHDPDDSDDSDGEIISDDIIWGEIY